MAFPPVRGVSDADCAVFFAVGSCMALAKSASVTCQSRYIVLVSHSHWCGLGSIQCSGVRVR